MSRFDDVLNKKAVALSYDENKQAAPVIVASGMGYLAERMVEVAKEAGVPVYEDDSLATILTQMELGAEVPEELYQAIVDIYVYFLNFAGGKPAQPKEKEEAAAEEVYEEQTEAGDFEEGVEVE